MLEKKLRDGFQYALDERDTGVTIDGNAPWDPQVYDTSFYRDVLCGSLRIGEAYMEGK